jgi:hypothetical protein
MIDSYNGFNNQNFNTINILYRGSWSPRSLEDEVPNPDKDLKKGIILNTEKFNYCLSIEVAESKTACGKKLKIKRRAVGPKFKTT